MSRKISIFLLIILSFTTTYAQEQDTALATEVVARINEWRIEEGVWPLRTNTTLEAMALSHAQYLASLSELPDDLHAGETGLNPRERALLEPFDWPHYELPAQIAIGENAGIGTVDYAMNYWHNSETHRNTALNPAYREVGVAAVPYKNQHIFIVVFGGRPNILPALFDPRDGQTIYLSNESFEYANFFDSIHSVVSIQLFNADGQPLFNEPIPWSDRITIPDGTQGIIYMLLTDGEHQILSVVNLETDVVITLDSMIAPEAVEEAIEETVETVAETTGSSDTADTVTDTEVVQSTPAPAEPTATPTLEPTVAPTEASDEPDILMVYTNDTLDILNVSGENADWSTLELRGVITVPFTQFTRVTEVDLTAFPNRHCLQVRSNGVSGDVVKQDNCNWVRSLVTVQPDRLFWKQTPFDVVRNGVVVGTCQPEESVCAIKFE